VCAVYAFVCIRNFNGFSGISNKLMESKNRKQFQTSCPDQRHILLLLLTGIPNLWVKYGTCGIKVFGRPCQCFLYNYSVWPYELFYLLLYYVLPQCHDLDNRLRRARPILLGTYHNNVCIHEEPFITLVEYCLSNTERIQLHFNNSKRNQYNDKRA